MIPVYKERDIVAQGEVYLAHVEQMTAQGLHSKSAIAAELAHRDILIADLEEMVVNMFGIAKVDNELIKEFIKRIQS